MHYIEAAHQSIEEEEKEEEDIYLAQTV